MWQSWHCWGPSPLAAKSSRHSRYVWVCFPGTRTPSAWQYAHISLLDIRASATVACGAATWCGPRIVPSGVRWQAAQVMPAPCVSSRGAGFAASIAVRSGMAKGCGKWQTLHRFPPSSASRAWIGHGSVPAIACALAVVEEPAGIWRSSSPSARSMTPGYRRSPPNPPAYSR
jgi:hypothetical protein